MLTEQQIKQAIKTLSEKHQADGADTAYELITEAQIK